MLTPAPCSWFVIEARQRIEQKQRAFASLPDGNPSHLISIIVTFTASEMNQAQKDSLPLTLIG